MNGMRRRFSCWRMSWSANRIPLRGDMRWSRAARDVRALQSPSLQERHAQSHILGSPRAVSPDHVRSRPRHVSNAVRRDRSHSRHARHREGPRLRRRRRLVIDAYSLAFTGALLASGALADRFGRRRSMLAGNAVFLIASIACGGATDGMLLLAARVAQ